MIVEKILIILIGFSIISACILMVVYSSMYRKLGKSWLSILSAIVLLLTFLIVQSLHLYYLDEAEWLFSSKLYSSLILISAPAFYFFVKEYIELKQEMSWFTFLHFLPLILNLFIDNFWSIPSAFLIGSIYALRCVYSIFVLKEERQRFRFELLALAFFLVIAIAILFLGLIIPRIDAYYFLMSYGILIGLSFVLVVTTLLVFPDVAKNLSEAVARKYTKSSLLSINKEDSLNKLSQLMTDDKLYRNESLNLNLVSSQLKLSPHQLSELINTQYGFGFSHFIRNHRITEAKQLLVDEPKSSILSISLATGFTSQSTFYTAFGQIVGITPGKYRQSHSKTSKS